MASTRKNKERASRSNEWQYFERLVAAIHKAADHGAEVRWNEIINGRQFDVIIRFKKGLYDYLTVVECKDYGTAVPVGEVEAFVTKAADVHAHQAVMASTSGFQSGAQEVAAKHNIELILVTESSEIDPSVFGAQWGDDIDALSIETIELEYADGERKTLPEQSNAMTYYVNQIVLQTRADTRTLDSIISEQSVHFRRGQRDEYMRTSIDCPPDTKVVGPDDGEIPLKSLVRIHIRAALVKAKTLIGPRLFDPSLLVRDVKVKKLTTGEETTYRQANLPLGINTVFQVGQFYEQTAISHYFYCDRIEGDTATIYLIESYQLGQLVQAETLCENQGCELVCSSL
jgi:hypothetical protein